MKSIKHYSCKTKVTMIVGLILVSSLIIVFNRDESEDREPIPIVLFTPKELDEFSQWNAFSKSTDLWLNAITAGLYDIGYDEDEDDYYQYYPPINPSP